MFLSAAIWSYPDVDPVLIEIGPLAIRWYALSYIAGIVLGFYYIKRLNHYSAPPLIPTKPLENMMVWAILGIILGGRLGYVLFYKPEYYLSHVSEALAIWHGGMSFHGGLLGVIFAFYLFARQYNISYLRLMDLIACAAPIGLFFGRLSNFINGELFGRISDVPWAMVFPHGGPEPRHPSQLYEAGLEGLSLFIILFLCVHYTSLRQRAGALSGIFLVGYGCARAFVELFRQPDAHLGFIAAHLTMGQLLCVPMVLAGLYFIKIAKQEKQ